MNRSLFLVILMLLAVSQVSAQNYGLYLELDAYGDETYAVWKAGEGLPDTNGSTNYALEFEKSVPHATPAAAFARVKNVWGRPISFLTEGTGLSWERRNDGDCFFAPRWNIQVKGKSGAMYWIMLPCPEAQHMSGSMEGWTRDSFTATDIMNKIIDTHGSNAADILSGKILQLYIPFNMGNDIAKGYVYLDNIRVNEKVWTSSEDNVKQLCSP